MEFKNINHLKSFMKKESDRLGLSIENTYNTYFARELLRIMGEKDKNNVFVTKGSFSQLVNLGKMVRPITDVDLTSTISHHDPLIVLIQAICSTKEDNVELDLRGKPKVTNTGMYKIPLIAKYKNGKFYQNMNMDYRENHPCILEQTEKPVPKIFEGDKEYKVIVPSIEETLAEKLCILVESNKKDVLNTRVKDFYDIYKMHDGEYDIDKFTYYFKIMLLKRGKITLENASAEHLNHEFLENHQKEWEHSKKKYEFLDKDVTWSEALQYSKAVLVDQLKLAKKKTYPCYETYCKKHNIKFN